MIHLYTYILTSIPIIIQDYYKISLSSDSNLESFIEEKFRVTKVHLEKAMDPELHPDQLYISFASAAFRQEEPSLTPQVILLFPHPIKRLGEGCQHILLGLCHWRWEEGCWHESKASYLAEPERT